MDGEKKGLILILIATFLISSLSFLVYAALETGIDGEIGLDLIPEDVTNFTKVDSNASEIWKTNVGDLGNVNATQFDGGNGTLLNMLESWLFSLFYKKSEVDSRVDSLNISILSVNGSLSIYNDTALIELVNVTIGIVNDSLFLINGSNNQRIDSLNISIISVNDSLPIYNNTILIELVNGTALSINTTENIGNLYNTTSLIFAQMNNNTATIGYLYNATSLLYAQMGNTTANVQVLINSSNIIFNQVEATIFNLDAPITSWVAVNETNASYCAVGDYLDGSGFCTDINGTIDNRTASTTTLTYNITTSEGTWDGSSNISDTWYQRDGKSYNVTEDSGVASLLLIANFSIHELDFDEVIGRVSYVGGSGHEMEFFLLTIAGDWEKYDDITDTNGFVNFNFPVFDPSHHVVDGNVSIKFDHEQNGNPSHEFMIDYIAVVRGFASTSADHDGLSGRDSTTNHPWALDHNGSRNMTGNLTGEFQFFADGNISTKEWFLGLFNLKVNSTGSSTEYLNFNGSDLSFSEEKLNETIGLLDTNTDITCELENCTKVIYQANGTLYNQTGLALSINTTENFGNVYNATALLFAQINNNSITHQQILNGSIMNLLQLGINTAIPTRTLDVRGDGLFTGSLILNSSLNFLDSTGATNRQNAISFNGTDFIQRLGGASGGSVNWNVQHLDNIRLQVQGGTGDVIVAQDLDVDGSVFMGWERVFANDTSTDRVSVSCSGGKRVLGISCECSGCGGATNSLIFSQFTGDSSGRCLYGGSVSTIKIQLVCARMFD